MSLYLLIESSTALKRTISDTLSPAKVILRFLPFCTNAYPTSGFSDSLARSAVAVKTLPKGALVEIEVVAAIE